MGEMKCVTKNAAVFSGRNGLDFLELRAGVLRIPEVSLRVREAQACLDSLDVPRTDLFNYISGDDASFYRQASLKGLAAAIVQVGLYDRLLKTQRKPDFLVGNFTGDSALAVCSGELSLREMIECSPTLAGLGASHNVLSLVGETAPLLAGTMLTECRTLRHTLDAQGNSKHEVVQEGQTDLKKLVSSLFENEGVIRFITIGPAGAMDFMDLKSPAAEEIECIDSIELDPMLGWFWQQARAARVTLAQ